MGHTNNKKYGKTIRKPKLKKLREDFSKKAEKLNEQYNREQRQMRFNKDEMKKYPNIFEVD